jgi:K+-transporting ATPase ATPase A chain
MTSSSWSLLALFLILLVVLSWPLGIWLARLASGRLPAWMHKLEAPLYQLAGTSADKSMPWGQYALAVLAFNAIGVVAVYALQRLQFWLPFNPAAMGNISPDSSFNTAISFVTNTNWQGYGGESTMSYLSQMLGLAVQNFLSAATGIAVVFALFRGFVARSTSEIGNFWVDVTRITAWLLVPLSLVVALLFVNQGVIQNFDAYKDVNTGREKRARWPAAERRQRRSCHGTCQNRHADAGHGPGRVAGGDQAFRHQWGRFF